MLRITLAAAHLLALAIGLGAILFRAASLREAIGAVALRRAFRADTDWGIAAALWIGTGLWRYFGDFEKGISYYDHNHAFLAKMALLAVILALEVWPMMTLLRWRRAFRRGTAAEAIVVPAAARRIATISNLQALLVVVMVFLAAAMARGYGTPD